MESLGRGWLIPWFHKKKEQSVTEEIQEGSPLGFAEIGLEGSIKAGKESTFDLTGSDTVQEIREGFLGKRYIGLTRRVFRGEVDAWVWPVVGGLVGIAALTGLAVIEKKYRKGEDLKNLLEKIGITKEDVLGQEKRGVRERFVSLLRFGRR